MATYQATILDDVVDLHTGEPVRDSRVHQSTTPWRADLIAGTAGSGLSPGVADVVSLTPTSIRVSFVDPAVDNDALRSADSYKITPVRNVFSVTPENVAEPTYVDLEIDEQKTGVTYTLELQRLEKA